MLLKSLPARLAMSFLFTCLPLYSTHAAEFTDYEIAFAWAPIHIQDVNKRHANGRADYIAAFNYDGDWIATNNWDNLYNFPQQAYVYYAVTESTTHYFIYYMFYHPRDWVVSFLSGSVPFSSPFGSGAIGDTTHENDAEGALIVVHKDGSEFGHYEGMVTEAHGDLLAFTTFPTFFERTSGGGTVVGPSGGGTVVGPSGGGTVVGPSGGGTVGGFEGDPPVPPPTCGMTSLRRDPFGISDLARPCSYQEAAGHGMRACGVNENIDLQGREDSIVYHPDWFANFPPGRISGSDSIPVGYRLIPLSDLWSRRNCPSIFVQPWEREKKGSFRGDCSGMDYFSLLRCDKDAANPVWKWGNVFAFDPAKYLRENQCFAPAQSGISYADNYTDFRHAFPPTPPRYTPETCPAR